MDRISAPTLFVQGTVDTLFPLDEAVKNYRILRGKNVPTKMLWYCGGHGVCLTGQPDPDRVNNAVLAWLNRYVKGDQSVDTGARFDGVDQRGTVFTAPDYPPRLGLPLIARGKGALRLKAAGGAGPTKKATGPIAGITPARATNAVDVRLRAGRRGTRIVGAPRLTLAYRGTTTGRPARPQRVFAQLVDTRTGLVLGNQITPITVQARRPAPHGHAGAGDRGAHAARPRRDHAPARRQHAGLRAAAARREHPLPVGHAPAARRASLVRRRACGP